MGSGRTECDAWRDSQCAASIPPARGEAADQVEARLKKLGNAFRSITRTQEQLSELFGMVVPAEVGWAWLNQALEKRHPITHNLGVVDRKYLERSRAAERHGREARIMATEVEKPSTHAAKYSCSAIRTRPSG